MAVSGSNDRVLIEGYEFNQEELERIVTADKPRETSFGSKIGDLLNGGKKQKAINAIVGKFSIISTKDDALVQMVKRFDVVRKLASAEHQKLFVIYEKPSSKDDSKINIWLSIQNYDLKLRDGSSLGQLTASSEDHSKVVSHENLNDVLQPLCDASLLRAATIFDIEQGLNNDDSEVEFVGTALEVNEEIQQAHFKKLLVCCEKVYKLDAASSAGFAVEISKTSEVSPHYKVDCKRDGKSIYSVSDITESQCNALAFTVAKINARSKTTQQNLDDLVTLQQGVFGLDASACSGLKIDLTASDDSPAKYGVVCKMKGQEVFSAQEITKEEYQQLAVSVAVIEAKEIVEKMHREYKKEEYFTKTITYMTEDGSDSRALLLNDRDESFNSAKFVSCEQGDEVAGARHYTLTFQAQHNSVKTTFDIKYPFPLSLHKAESNVPGQRFMITPGQIYRGHTKARQSLQLKELFKSDQANKYTNIRDVLDPYFYSSQDIVLFEAVKPILMKLDERTGGKGECFHNMETMKVLHEVKVGDTSVAELAQEPTVIEKLEKKSN
ncbi:hypothetical protein D5R81_17555 [Parashewanella spongiae]|uniref:Uncharacterized protein n=1 Tax=Parashewanella spongiae TaxID=342950 RepID=A0A3A6TGN5_9GAMM|nr:hypothetical protein [Parashewanella spongiae]MCL1079873.1 hypothetical protein [Parashewanella spongiae]RJY06655.1 hypothetical protein D5R81_17555 [Parashewanella spongiae]